MVRPQARLFRSFSVVAIVVACAWITFNRHEQGPMNNQKPIGVGVIGLGFIGRTHINAYHAAAAAGFSCPLIALCDHDPERFAGKSIPPGNLATKPSPQTAQDFDLKNVRRYNDPNQVFADPNVHLVSICTYTDTHVDLAIAALRAGKHILVEKPVATKSAEVRRLADVARDAPTLCMPAMCMRFWPGWDWLRERIMDQTLGPVRSATFERLGARPSWAADFYRDPVRSGGALFDLHVHDADFIYWCFGKPQTVFTSGSLEHLTTLYHYSSGPDHVSAEGGWTLAPSAGFRMRYIIAFERATAEFDLTHTPSLMLHDSDGSRPVKIAELSAYDLEIRHLIDAVAHSRTTLRATLDDAVAVTQILEAERSSLQTGRPVSL